MSHKRFLKLFLFVLALALWAGTAYGSGTLGYSPSGTVTFTYTQFQAGSAPNSLVTIAEGVTDTTDTITLPASPPQWLTQSCNGYTVTAAGPDTGAAVSPICTYTLNTAYLDSHSTTSYNATVTPILTSTGVADLTPLTINLTVTLAYPTFTAVNSPVADPIALTYTQFGASQAGNLTTATITVSTNDDTTGASQSAYTLGGTCANWLTTTAGAAITTIGGTSTVSLSLNDANADALTGNQASCTVTIINAGLAVAATRHVTLTLIGGRQYPTFTATNSPVGDPIPLTYTQFGASQSGNLTTATITVSTNDDTTGASESGYTLGGTCANWLTKTAGAAITTIGGTSTVSLSLNDANADALTGNQASCTVTILNTVGTVAATSNVTLTLTGGRHYPTFTAVNNPVPDPIALTYTQFAASQAGNATTATITVSTNDDTTGASESAYTLGGTCANWLTKAAGAAITTIGGTSVVSLSLNDANADALTGNQASCTVTILNAVGVVAATSHVTLTLTGGRAYPTFTAVNNPVADPIALTYTQFGANQAGNATTATITVSTNDDTVGASESAYTLGGTCANWLTKAAGTAITTIGGTSVVSLSLNHPNADALTGNQASCTVTILNAGGSVAATSDVTLTLTGGRAYPTFTAVNSPVADPIALSYTQFAANQAGNATTATITVSTNDDTTGASESTYTLGGTCANWLTKAAGAAITTIGGTSVVSLSLNHPNADALTGNQASCTVTILNAVGTVAATSHVTLTLTGGPQSPTLSATGSVAFNNYVKYQAVDPTKTVTITSNDDTANFSDPYTVTNGCSSWISLSTGSLSSATAGNVTSAQGIGGDSLVLTVIQSVVNALTLPPAACNINLTSQASGVIFATLTPTLSFGSPAVTATGGPFSLVYLQFAATQVGTVTGSLAITSTDIAPSFSDPYTFTNNCGTWLKVASASTPLVAGQGNVTSTGDTLNFSLNDGLVDALLVSPTAGGACTVTVSAYGSQIKSVNVTLGLTTGHPTLQAAGGLAPLVDLGQYALNSNSNAGTQTLAISSNDDTVTPDPYTITPNGSCTWLTIASRNATYPNGSVVSESDRLTFSVNTTVANHLTGTQAGCSVTLTDARAATFATVAVHLQVVNTSNLMANPTSLTFSTGYVKNSGSAGAPAAVTFGVSDTNTATTDTYSVAPLTATFPWLTCTGTTTTVGGPTNLTDTVTCTVVTGQADTLNAGSYTAAVHVDVATQQDVIVNVTLNVSTAASPLIPNISAFTLTYLVGGGGGQAAATKTISISTLDTTVDTYTVTAGYPSYLTVAPVKGTAVANNGDSVVFTLNYNPVPTTASSTVYPVLLHIANNGQTPDLRIVVTINVVLQPIVATPASVTLTATKSGGSTASTPPVLTVLPGMNSPLNITMDPSSVPVWLNVTPPATATTAGNSVTFAVNTTAATGMATGNYTANVGFAVAGYSAKLLIPVAFTISNSAPALSIKEGITTINNIWGPGQAIPTPTWTAVSSDEPIPFTASCAIVPTDTTYSGATSTCALSATAGVAYTWGDQLSANLSDPTLTGLFTSTLGNSFTVTVTLTPQGGQTSGPNGGAVSLTYSYKLAPVAPTASTISPTAAAHIAKNTNLVVLLTGTGFVGTANLKPGTLEQTQIWLGTNTGVGNALPATSYVVLSPTQMMVTIPETAFPAIPTGQTKAALAIGAANWTGVNQPTQPTAAASWTLNVTTNPVIYGMTSTASYVQPPTGSSPSFAPYELISVFGDNFGPTNGSLVTETLDAFNRVPTTISTGTNGGKSVNLTVVFSSKGSGTKTINYSAPILFANENQINAIVPSGLPVGYPAAVTVTSAGTSTAASDGLFNVSAITADPGIFTLASDGVGQGAILNHGGDVNQAGNGEHIGQFVSFYLTGLGAPDSTAYDMAGNAMTFPTGCVAVSYPTKGSSPGYLEVMNTKGTGYTPPSPAWTSIDGAVIEYSTTLPLKTEIVSGLPPCMTDPVTVVIGPAGSQVTVTETGVPGTGVTWAGLVSGAVAGLYQINAYIPAGTPTGDNVPVYVTITNSVSGTTYTSPTVSMAIKP